MAAAARGDMTDSVHSLTGTGEDCAFPIDTVTNVGSSNVRINGKGAVKIGDLVYPHPYYGCGPDTSTLSTGSSKVRVNGQPAARIGDYYTPDNQITSGSPNVFFA